MVKVPWVHRTFDLHLFVPDRLHNAWPVVAYLLVVSALLKAACDYAGTYLVNYAGFGMITDLRNDLYEAVIRRSVAFFQKHSTGTLLSTIINDIERVQYAMSTIMADFLQQFFTLVFTTCVAVAYGGYQFDKATYDYWLMQKKQFEMLYMKSPQFMNPDLHRQFDGWGKKGLPFNFKGKR